MSISAAYSIEINPLSFYPTRSVRSAAEILLGPILADMIPTYGFRFNAAWRQRRRSLPKPAEPEIYPIFR